MDKKIDKKTYEFCKFFEEEYGVTLIDAETGVRLVDYGKCSDNDGFETDS